MATSALGSVYIALTADAKNLQTTMANARKAVSDTGNAMVDTANKVTDAGNKIDVTFKKTESGLKNFSKSNREAANSARQLVPQLNDIFVSLAGGMPAFTVATQQGSQITQIFSQMGGGVGALKSVGQALLGMLSPMNLLTMGAIAVGGALAQHFLPKLWEMVTGGKDAKTVMENLEKSQTKYASSAKSAATSIGELRNVYGGLAEKIKEINEAIAESDRKQNLAKFGESVESRNKLGWWDWLNKPIGMSAAEDRGRDMGFDGKELDKYTFREESRLNLMKNQTIEAEKKVEIEQQHIEFLQRALENQNLTEEERKNLQAEITAIQSEQTSLMEHITQENLVQSQLLSEFAPEYGKIADLEEKRKTILEQIGKTVGEDNAKWQQALVAVNAQIEKLGLEMSGISETTKTMIANATGFAEQMRTTMMGLNNMSGPDSGIRINSDGTIAPNQFNSGRTEDVVVDIIIREENSSRGNFRRKAGVNKMDSGKLQYRVGYESDTITNPDGSYRPVVAGDTVDQAGAERDLRRRINESMKRHQQVVGEALYNSLSDQQKAVLVSIEYNYGANGSGIKKTLAALKNGGIQAAGRTIQQLSYDNGGIRAQRYERHAKEFLGGELDQNLEKTHNEEVAQTKKLADENERIAKAKADALAQADNSLGITKQTSAIEAERDAKIAAVRNNTALTDAQKLYQETLITAEAQKRLEIERAIAQAKLNKSWTPELEKRITEEAQIRYDAAANAAKVKLGVDQTNQSLEFQKNLLETIHNGFENIFVGVITGAKSAREALSQMLAQLAQMFASRAFQSLWNGSAPGGAAAGGGLGGWVNGIIDGLFGKHANGGLVDTPYQMVGERGAELVSLPFGSRVHTASQTQRMLNGAGAGGATIQVSLSPDLEARILSKANQNSVKISKGSIADYNRQLPRKVDAYSRDPRAK